MRISLFMVLAAALLKLSAQTAVESSHECDGGSWKIAISSNDRGLLLPMRMHLGGNNVSILALTDGCHATTHELHLPPIQLIWTGSGQACCDMRDLPSFIEYLDNWEVETTLRLQLVDLSRGVAPLTVPLCISQGSIDVMHKFNEVINNGPITSQQNPPSAAAGPNARTCSWSTSISISILTPPSYVAHGLLTVAHLKSDDILRVLISVNELGWKNPSSAAEEGVKVLLHGMKFTPFWIFVHNHALSSPQLFENLNPPPLPVLTLDDVHAPPAATDGDQKQDGSLVFWIDLLHSHLSPRGCPPSSSATLRRMPNGQRICSSGNGSAVLAAHELAFITTTSRQNWHAALAGAYGGRVHVFSCASRLTTTEATGNRSGSDVHVHPWCLSASASPLQPSQPPLFRPPKSFHDNYKATSAPLTASCETGRLVQRLRGSLSVEAAAAMICGSNHTGIASLNLLHVDVGTEGWCILSDVASSVDSGRGPVVDQITAVLPIPCTSPSSSKSSSSSRSRCAAGACNVSAIVLQDKTPPPQWMKDAMLMTSGEGTRRNFLLAAAILEKLMRFYVAVVVDELQEDIMRITLMRKELWPIQEVASQGVSSSTSSEPAALREAVDSQPLPPCAQGPVCVCGFLKCSPSSSASSCLPPPLLRFVAEITRLCALPRMKGKCKGLVQKPLSCSAVGDNSDDDGEQRMHPIRCTGEPYGNLSGSAGVEAVMILEQNDALKRLVEYGLWHGNMSASIVASMSASMTASMPGCRSQNDVFSSSATRSSSTQPPWQQSSSMPSLTDDSNVVISSIRKGSGGLGNVIYSMIVGLTVAVYSESKRFYASMYTEEAWKRYGGLFSAAVDDNIFSDRSYGQPQDHCPNEQPYGVPAALDDDYWAWSYMKYATTSTQQISKDWMETPITHCIVCSQWSKFHSLVLVVQQPIAPAVTLLSQHSGPVIHDELGDMLVTFLSNFLFTPAPGLRIEIESIMKRMRSMSEPSPFIIGIHMRWAHESQTIFERPLHAQYAARVGLSSADFGAFVDAAHALAEGHQHVVFYIASDSLTRLMDLKQALSQSERSWSVVTANVLTNVSDGTTADSIVDLFVLSMCDDLIASHTSTFSHIAAALGAHRPVLISAELSFKFGRRSLRRSRTLDWTMPTDEWAAFTPDLPFESWISGGMSYGARPQAIRCQNISEEEAAAAMDVAASFFVELNRTRY